VHERDARLVAEDGVVSADQRDASRSASELAVADREVAAAEVAVAQAEVRAARVELLKTVLIAPFDAVIAEVGVELGEWVTPSVPLIQAPDLIDAIDPTSLYVSAPMDEADAQVFHVDQAVRVTIDSHPGRSFSGRVARIAPYVLDLEQQNRTLEIEVELEDEAFSETLYPGTSADVEVLLETRTDVLRVPTFALTQGPGVAGGAAEGARRAFVLADGVLARRDVTIGLSNWEWTEVVSGLAEGERVVTSLDRPGVEAGAEAVESAERAR
jgi:HlyD family secretion protein